MGERYDALMRVAGLPLDDSAEDRLLSECLEEIEKCRQEAAAYRAEPGLTGATRDAALSWLDEYDQVLAQRATSLKGSKGQHDQAREVMRQARDKANELPVQLMTRGERSILASEPELLLQDGTRVSGNAYAATLMRERDEERDARAGEILTEMNASVRTIPIDPPAPVPTDSPDTGGTSQGHTGAGGSGRATGTGGPHGNATGGTYSAGVSTAAGGTGLVGAAVLANRATSGATQGSSHWARPVPTGHLVTDPAELSHKKLSELSVHPPMSSDGSTRGYVPPSILDRDDPRWSATHVPEGFENRAGTSRAGMLVGGVLGAGASALAARGATSGLTGLSLSGSTAAGLVGRVPGTGMLGTGMLSSTAGAASGSAGAGAPPPAGMAGQTAAGQAGAAQAGAGQAGRASSTTVAGRSGSLGRASTSASATSTAGGGSQQGSAASANSRGMMAPHQGTSGQGRDRDRATLVGYDVQRLDEGATESPAGGDSRAAGSAQTLSPVRSEDAGEEW